MSTRLGTLLSIVWVCAGCNGLAPMDLGTNNEAVETLNGISRNGISRNGISRNGISRNGTTLNGISRNGVALNGIDLNGIHLDGSSLTGVSSATGETLSGTDLVGAGLVGLLSDGSTLALRIDSARWGVDSDADVLFYGVSYEAASGWSPLCGVDATGAVIEAVALDGIWNEWQGPGGGAHVSDPTQ